MTITPPDCSGYLSSFGPAATACSGFYSGNVLNNSTAGVSTQTSALADLGFTFTDFNDYQKLASLNGSTIIDFGKQLIGDTIIGIHFGQSSGVGQSTGFFEFNFTSPVSSITLALPASSDVVLYTTGVAGVPEPGTWATMLLGFLAMGLFLRRRRPRGLALQAA